MLRRQMAHHNGLLYEHQIDLTTDQIRNSSSVATVGHHTKLCSGQPLEGGTYYVGSATLTDACDCCPIRIFLGAKQSIALGRRLHCLFAISTTGLVLKRDRTKIL